MNRLIVILILIIFLFTFGSCRTSPPSISYESYSYTYTAPIKPSQYTQSDMETHIQQYWNYWSGKYLKHSTVNTAWYYVLGESNGDTPSSWGSTKAKATSEGHGYGMIITALMNRQTEFDGLYNMYRSFRSTINNNLMSWIIPENEDTDLRSDSASDGDIDIAYALLLADAKWGSDGTIDYKTESVLIINAIMESEISHTTWRVLLGDWDSDNYSTRPSDWIPDHFRAFKEATGDTRWDNVIETLYDTRIKIYSSYSPVTGLMPDFAVEDPPEPAPAYFLEDAYDGDYYYNACRVPWRIACDYVLYGSSNGKKPKITLQAIENWITDAAGGNPAVVKAGYRLNGTPLAEETDMCFTAPFIAGAVSDPEYQNFLDSGWDLIKESESNYFNDTIIMLTMLLVSGIWQAP